MRIRPSIIHLLPPVALLLHTGSVCAARFDLSIDKGLLDQSAQLQSDAPISSGLDLALQNRMFNMAVDYNVQVNMAGTEIATDDDTAQHVGASLDSALINRMLGGTARVNANSFIHSTSGAYNHRVIPNYTRKLNDLATLDLNYQYFLNRPSKEVVPLEHHTYSFGLRGSLQGGRLNWSSTYSSADIYRDSAAHIMNSESLRFHSDYRLLPQIQLSLNTAVMENTQFGARHETSFVQTQYGAGLSWKPSTRYALDFNMSQSALSHTGEEILLRQGTVSWFPRQDMSLSLNYGDTLVEGAPGVLLNTRLDLGRL